MDIVERLRHHKSSDVWTERKNRTWYETDDLCMEAADEIERLQKQIRYQEHRDGRIGTHDPICYGYGPSHYECALRKIDMLRELLNADNQTLRLHFGELTLNEMRIVKAAFQWVLIRAELKEDE